MTWTKELVKKLKYFVEHRDYIVRASSLEDNIVKITPVDSVPNPEKYDTIGWFAIACDPDDDRFELDSYNPNDFKIFKLMNNWINE